LEARIDTEEIYRLALSSRTAEMALGVFQISLKRAIACKSADLLVPDALGMEDVEPPTKGPSLSSRREVAISSLHRPRASSQYSIPRFAREKLRRRYKRSSSSCHRPAYFAFPSPTTRPNLLGIRGGGVHKVAECPVVHEGPGREIGHSR
jgi:hypothetical protein